MPAKTPVPQSQKVFCFFFTKKKCFLRGTNMPDKPAVDRASRYDIACGSYDENIKLHF